MLKKTPITQKPLNFRHLCAFLLAMSVAATAIALMYFQRHLGLEPCPLCIFQRIGVWVMGAFALIGVLINPKRYWAKLVIWVGMLAGVLWGGGVAVRHVWLQHLPPDQVPACGPGLNYWVDTLPIMQVFEQVLKGSGECATIDWSFLGLSIPALTLLMFLGFLLVLVFGFMQTIKK